MSYYICPCPECKQPIHVHRVHNKIVLKNTCEHFIFYQSQEPLHLNFTERAFNKTFRTEINSSKNMITVLR